MNINKLNILFIGDANSVHDLKWVELLANNNSFKMFFLPTCDINKENLKLYGEEKLKNISFLEPISNFTLLRINKFIKNQHYLNSIIKNNYIDILHISFAAPNSLWSLFINNKKVKTIITFHGSDLLIVIPELLIGKGIRSLYNKFLWKLFKKTFIKANVITCASNLLKKRFIEMTSRTENVVIIRSGVNIEPCTTEDNSILNDLPNNRKIVFSPRFMSPIYDINIQVDALSFLPDYIINQYCFVFINTKNSDYSEKIKIKLDKLANEKSLVYKFLPLLSKEQIQYVYKKSSLVIMTPLSDGTPSTALEAMALKIPLIISDLNYDYELFDNTCIRLKKRDPKELANLITDALNNYSSDMLNLAYKNVKQSGNIKLEMEKLSEIYLSLK